MSIILNNDFNIEGNHARISQRKVAEITKVSQPSVSNWIDSLTDRNMAETLVEKGFWGDKLKEFVTYLALDAKRITQEVRNHNIKLLSDASDYGFQMLIDKMAGINIQPVQPQVKEDEVKQFNDILDSIFSNVPIKPELIAGIKLNTAKELAPQFAKYLEPARQLLINNTATDRQLMTVTEIGRKLNPPLSAIAVNKLLIKKGFQVKNLNRKSKKDPAYIPTSMGRDYSDLTLATLQNNADTSQQLRWYDSLMKVI